MSVVHLHPEELLDRARREVSDPAGRDTLEAALRYRLELGHGVMDLTLRGRNLTNALHSRYTGISPDQLTLAPPRSVDLMATLNF